MPAPGGVNSNLFALLDDEDNDEDTTPVQKAPAKPAPKAKSEEQPKKADNRERKQGGKGGDNRRGGKDRNDNHQDAYDGSDKPIKPSEGEGRGKGNRRRYDDGERGKGKGKGGNRRGREFDRHLSGTGRGKGEQARDGRGKYNWGEKTEGVAENAAGSADADVENKAPEEAPAPEPEEEEENTMTLEEYMKAQSEKGRVGPVLEERHVEDKKEGFKYDRGAHGADEDSMYGMIFHEYDGKHHGKDEKHEREGWVTADDVLNLKFADHNSGGGKGDRGDRRSKGKKGGDRGGKGGDRAGRGPRGGGGGGRPQVQQGKIELEDTNAFPSLA
jgi:hypothetical protein